MAEPADGLGENGSEIKAGIYTESLGRGLQSGGGGSTYLGMEALIDAKVAAAEARTDAKFAQVLAKLDSMDKQGSNTRSTVWQAAFAIMGLIVALVALAATIVPSAFSTGANMREMARDEARAASAPTPSQSVGAKSSAK